VHPVLLWYKIARFLIFVTEVRIWVWFLVHYFFSGSDDFDDVLCFFSMSIPSQHKLTDFHLMQHWRISSITSRHFSSWYLFSATTWRREIFNFLKLPPLTVQTSLNFACVLFAGIKGLLRHSICYVTVPIYTRILKKESSEENFTSIFSIRKFK
jgi:hypothetical protein